MKKCYLVLTFLLSIVTVFLLSPISLAAVHHARVQPQSNRRTYLPGTAYYTFSSLVTTGSNAGTIGAVNSEGGLTLYIKQDGTFSGIVTANLASVHKIGGSFQPDGSILLNNPYGLGTIWQGKAQPRGYGKYIGTFVVSYTGVAIRSGIWALVPVHNPQNVISLDLSALITAGPDQNKPYGGAMILNPRVLHGTLRLQDGDITSIFTRIAQTKITFKFGLNNHSIVAAIGTSTSITTNSGTVIKYTGTFVGPHRGDSGNWSGFLFTFAL